MLMPVVLVVEMLVILTSVVLIVSTMHLVLSP